jgi:hypothetical protein
MDVNLVYEKTPAGEEAVKQRTRVVQRNMRMVLILVDGKSTVAELYEKTGNAQIVDGAIADLERDGLIAPKLEQDSMWEQSRRIAEEIKAAAVTRLAREDDRPVLKAELPQSLPLKTPQVESPEPFSIASNSIAPMSTFGGHPSSMSAFSTFGGVPPVIQVPPVADEVTPPPVEEAKPGLLARLLSRKDRDKGIGKVRSGERKTFISLPLAISLLIVGALGLMVLVFLLYPYNNHKPQIEAAIGKMVGQPMKVGGIAASLLPKPAITLSDVRSEAAGGVRISRIGLVPEVLTLVGVRSAFMSVDVDGLSLEAAGVAVLPRAIATALSPVGDVSIAALRINNASLDLMGLRLGDLQGDMRQQAGGAALPVLLSAPDRSLKLSLQERDGNLAGDVEAYAWRPHEQSRFRFDSIQARVLWNGARLEITSLDARIFGGAVLGTLVLDTQQGQPGIAGNLDIKHMDIQRLLGGLGEGEKHQGEFAGRISFGARSTSWANLLGSASGEGTFVATRGALGVDVVEAVRRGKGSVQGGATRFEQMSGNVRITPESIRLTDVSLSSGLLKANGMIDVVRDGRVAGRLDVEMRGSANLVRMPVAPAGTLRDPVISAGR